MTSEIENEVLRQLMRYFHEAFKRKLDELKEESVTERAFTLDNFYLRRLQRVIESALNKKPGYLIKNYPKNRMRILDEIDSAILTCIVGREALNSLSSSSKTPEFRNHHEFDRATETRITYGLQNKDLPYQDFANDIGRVIKSGRFDYVEGLLKTIIEKYEPQKLN